MPNVLFESANQNKKSSGYLVGLCQGQRWMVTFPPETTAVCLQEIGE